MFPDADVEAALAPAFETEAIEGIEVPSLVGSDWHPAIGETTLGIECVERGNSVTAEEVGAVIDGDRYELCCGSYQARFADRYEELSQGL
jgi:hypothetical protein